MSNAVVKDSISLQIVLLAIPAAIVYLLSRPCRYCGPQQAMASQRLASSPATLASGRPSLFLHRIHILLYAPAAERC